MQDLDADVKLLFDLARQAALQRVPYAKGGEPKLTWSDIAVAIACSGILDQRIKDRLGLESLVWPSTIVQRASQLKRESRSKTTKFRYDNMTESWLKNLPGKKVSLQDLLDFLLDGAEEDMEVWFEQSRYTEELTMRLEQKLELIENNPGVNESLGKEIRDTVERLKVELSNNIVGHDLAIKQLCQSVMVARIAKEIFPKSSDPPALFLIVGRRGTGRKRLALEFVKSLQKDIKTISVVNMANYGKSSNDRSYERISMELGTFERRQSSGVLIVEDPEHSSTDAQIRLTESINFFIERENNLATQSKRSESFVIILTEQSADQLERFHKETMFDLGTVLSSMSARHDSERRPVFANFFIETLRQATLIVCARPTLHDLREFTEKQIRELAESLHETMGVSLLNYSDRLVLTVLALNSGPDFNFTNIESVLRRNISEIIVEHSAKLSECRKLELRCDPKHSAELDENRSAKGILASRKRLVFKSVVTEEKDKIVVTFTDLKAVTVYTGEAADNFEVQSPGAQFSMVGGNEDAIRQLEFIRSFLRSPDRYNRLGARMHRAVLLVGPPGTGKTLIARSLCGELDCASFIQARASTWITIWQGSGAESVRQLFSLARQHAPCVVFIDELDAVAKKRTGEGDHHNTVRAMITQLMVEMDGFTQSQEPVIVLAATNRVEDIDDAILRRFDTLVHVGLPGRQDRKKILEIHSRDKAFSPDLDWQKFADITPGLSGADLEKLINQSLIQAGMSGETQANETHVLAALDLLRFGASMPNAQKMSESMRYRVAVHEGGHAILMHLLRGNLGRISLLSADRMAGYVMGADGEDTRPLLTTERLLNEMAILLAGKAAEVLLTGESSEGCKNDLERATYLATIMVMEFGMGGSLSVYSPSRNQARPNLSQARMQQIEIEVDTLLSRQYARAQHILTANLMCLKELAEKLMIDETLEQAEILSFFSGRSTFVPEHAEALTSLQG